MKAIRTSDVYSYISTLALGCDAFSLKPNSESTPDTSYLYLSVVSDNPDIVSFQGISSKLARISFNIFSKTTLAVGEDEETVLMDIVDILDTELAKESCNKVFTLGTINVIEILSDVKSPIMYNEKDRPFIVKDYFIRYESE